MAFTPCKIFIQSGLEGTALASRAGKLAPSAVLGCFDDLPALLRDMEALGFSQSKKVLIIAKRSGGFVKDFPAAPGIPSPGWRYFIPAIGCPADCRYCFLRTYHPAGAPVIFAEQAEMLREIEALLDQSQKGYFYGGELCDNLMLERYLALTGPLLTLFRRAPGATLELRTKSDDVDALLSAGPARNVIISWTLGPAEIAGPLEPGTAAVASRISAARKLQKAGFRVGLRFDPIVLAPGWADAYEKLVRDLSRQLDPLLVESVHLGCMRYLYPLKADALSTTPTPLLAAEFAPCGDGKFRYPRPLRTAAYVAIAGLIRRWSAGISVRLVMEPASVCRDFHHLLPA